MELFFREFPNITNAWMLQAFEICKFLVEEDEGRVKDDDVSEQNEKNFILEALRIIGSHAGITNRM